MAEQFIAGFRQIRQNKMTLLRMLILTAGMICGGISGILRNCTVLLIAVFLVWIHNIVLSCQNLKQYFLFAMFHGTLFLFLLGRPLVLLFREKDWVQWQCSTYYSTEIAVFQVLLCIFFSLLFLWVGAELAGWIHSKVGMKEKVRKNGKQFPASWKDTVRTAAFWIFWAAAACKLALEMEKMWFVMQHSYLDYYAVFSSRIPYIIQAGASFMEYAMYFYLATLPGKKQSCFTLGTFILVSIPMFLEGQRGTFILNCCVVLVYFVIREMMEKQTHWIGRVEKCLLGVMLPVGVIVLGAMDFVREGKVMRIHGFFSLFLDFIQKQGVTFSWICAGMTNIDLLRSQRVTSYTFGNLIDYVLHGKAAQVFFGAEALAGNNSIQAATESNSMAHHLSYTLFTEEYYLAGHGTGSSYLFELYADYGLIGVMMFSLIIGVFLTWVFYKAQKSFAVFVVLLCATKGILFMPRAEAIGGFEFLWRISFRMMVIFCMGIVWLSSRRGKAKLERRVRK